MARAAQALALAVLLAGCQRCSPLSLVEPSYPKSTPKDARLQIPSGAFAKLTAADRELVERHVRASLRWQVWEERGKRYAARRALEHEQWVDGSNGFHSDFNATDITQTRVVLGLDGEHGFGVERGQVTRGAPGSETQLVLEKYMDQPGLQSYLIVSSPSGLTFEFFEQAKNLKRIFTRQALAEVDQELSQLLSHRDDVMKLGYAESIVPKGSVRREAVPLTIEDGFQGGIFQATAWINPGARGVCFMRVFYTGKPSPKDKVPEELRDPKETALSAERVQAASRRLVGWGPDPSVRFLYRAGLTVYEGDWDHSYPARFELWFRDDQGKERKLDETSRLISGWQR
jgi:hypothetical protein